MVAARAHCGCAIRVCGRGAYVDFSAWSVTGPKRMPLATGPAYPLTAARLGPSATRPCRTRDTMRLIATGVTPM